MKNREKEEKNTKKDNEYTDYDEEQAEMGDKFDVIKQAITVNSPISTLNPDFIMSDLNENLMNNAVMKYVRIQLNIVEAINIYLTNEELQDKEYRMHTNQIILNNVYSMVNLSRADKAKVINAILDYIRNAENGVSMSEPAPTNNSTESEGNILSKMNPMNWGKKK